MATDNIITDDTSMIISGDNDTITTTASSNYLLGGNGIDMINGGADDDFIAGGNGDDLINTSTGYDSAFGGAGNDTNIGQRYL